MAEDPELKAAAAAKKPAEAKMSVRTKITNEARFFALQIVRNETYRKNLLTRAMTGTLPPAIESMLWAYSYGKPVKNIDIKINDQRTRELADLTSEELAERAKELSRQIIVSKQMQEQEDEALATAVATSVEQAPKTSPVAGSDPNRVH